MSASEWREVCGVFFEALDQRPELRADFVNGRCPDGSRRRLVLALLESHGKSAGILDESPPVRFEGKPLPVLRAGQILSRRYQIVRLLGVGGIGEVYEALDLAQAGAKLAVKVLRQTGLIDFRATARFKRETRLARKISHPNVCRVYAQAEDSAHLYIAMEYLDGVTLARRIEESGRISVREGCAIGRQLADGLDAAHQARIIHRDFKPSNVILTRNPDDTSRAVITDFGLARLSGRQTGTPARTTQPLGTLHYMSPEQADGRPADARSDVYALGIVLWEMFTGNRPLPGEASPRIDAPRLPKSWEQIVLRCVERSPSERFANAGEVRLAMARTA